jgi:hypothetical protein
MDDVQNLLFRSLYTNTTRLTETAFQTLVDLLTRWAAQFEHEQNNAAVLDLRLRLTQIQVELQVRQGKRPSVGL